MFKNYIKSLGGIHGKTRLFNRVSLGYYNDLPYTVKMKSIHAAMTNPVENLRTE